MEHLNLILELLFTNDPESQEDVKSELTTQEIADFEDFFNQHQALLSYIKKYKGVPFDGDEDEYDHLISLVDKKHPGYKVFSNILADC